MGILTTLFSDLFGKDVQDRLSYTYDWMADQFGHISLGFFPTALLYWELQSTSWLIPASVFAFWTAKEIRDYFSVTLYNENKIFKPNVRDLVYNVHCALVYFSVGISFAISTFVFGTTIGVVLPFVASLFYGYWWIILKMNLQASEMPYMARLSSIDEQIVYSEDIQLALDLTYGKKGSFIILGPKDAGKTTLGLAISTEYIFNGHTARFFTFNEFLENQETIEQEIIVIDDVAPFMMVEDTSENQTYVEHHLVELHYVKDSNKTYIWIVGDYSNTDTIWEKTLGADDTIRLHDPS